MIPLLPTRALQTDQQQLSSIDYDCRLAACRRRDRDRPALLLAAERRSVGRRDKRSAFTRSAEMEALAESAHLAAM